MVHKLRDAASGVEKELNTTRHELSRFGSFEVRPVPVMKYRGWLFHVKSEQKPKINKESIALLRRLFTKHLHDQGIEVPMQRDTFSAFDPPRNAELAYGSVVDHKPNESKLRPYNWLWTLTLVKEKRPG